MSDPETDEEFHSNTNDTIEVVKCRGNYQCTWSTLFGEDEKAPTPPPYTAPIAIPPIRTPNKRRMSRIMKGILRTVLFCVSVGCCLVCWWAAGWSSGRNVRYGVRLTSAPNDLMVVSSAKVEQSEYIFETTPDNGNSQLDGAKRIHQLLGPAASTNTVNPVINVNINLPEEVLGKTELRETLNEAISPKTNECDVAVRPLEAHPAASVAVTESMTFRSELPESIALKTKSDATSKPMLMPQLDAQEFRAPSAGPIVATTPPTLQLINPSKKGNKVETIARYEAGSLELSKDSSQSQDIDASEEAEVLESYQKSETLESYQESEDLTGTSCSDRVPNWTELIPLPGAELNISNYEFRQCQSYGNFQVPDAVELGSFQEYDLNSSPELFHTFENRPKGTVMVIYARLTVLTYASNGITIALGDDIRCRWTIRSQFRLEAKQADVLARCAKLSMSYELGILTRTAVRKQFLALNCYLFHDMSNRKNDHVFRPDWLAKSEMVLPAEVTSGRNFAIIFSRNYKGMKILTRVKRTKYIPAGKIALLKQRMSWLRLNDSKLNVPINSFIYRPLRPHNRPVNVSMQLTFSLTNIGGAEHVPVLVHAHSVDFMEASIYHMGTKHLMARYFKRNSDDFCDLPGTIRYQLASKEFVTKIVLASNLVVGVHTSNNKTYPETIPMNVGKVRILVVKTRYIAFAMTDNRARVCILH